MSTFSPGRSYWLKNGHSGLYAGVEENKATIGARLDQWFKQDDPNKHDNKVWHLFPLDSGAYLFANKNSGLVMNVVGNSTATSARVEQKDLQSSGRSQAWLIEHVSGKTYHVRNEKSTLYLKIFGYSTEKGKPLEQHSYRENGEGAASQKWEFEVEDEYERVLNLPTFEDAHIGDIHRMTDFAPTPKETTDRVEVAAFAYPFVFVRDESYSRQRQAKENPYYILRKYGYWTRVFFHEHSGASEYTRTEGVTVGLTSKEAKSVEETTSISVSAEASFGFKGFGSSIRNTFAQEMKVTVTTEQITESSKTETHELRYPEGKHVSEAIWYRDNDYVLERLDGTKVIEWTVRDPKTYISDAWPNSAMAELEQWRAGDGDADGGLG